MIGDSLDLYDEVVSWYVSQTGVPLLSAGYRLAPEATTSTTLAELHVHPGAPHGFERFVPDAAVAQRAMADRTRAIAAI